MARSDGAYEGALSALRAAFPVLLQADCEDDVNRVVFARAEALPPGRGTVGEGADLYARRCAACHGTNGEGGAAEALVGGEPMAFAPFGVSTAAAAKC